MSQSYPILVWKPTSIWPGRPATPERRDSVQTTEKSAKLELSIAEASRRLESSDRRRLARGQAAMPLLGHLSWLGDASGQRVRLDGGPLHAVASRAILAVMNEATPKLRWYRLTPDRLVLLLLVVDCLLWLSNWLGWPAWHKGYTVLACMASVGVAMLAMLLWFGVALLFRGRFQFGVRSLLVLVVAVAIPCSWMAVEAKEERDATATIETHGGSVFRASLLPNALSGPLWLGECRYFDRVDVVVLRTPCRSPGNELIRALKKLRHMKYVRIERSTIEYLDLPDRPARLETAEIEAAIPDVPVSEWIY